MQFPLGVVIDFMPPYSVVSNQNVKIAYITYKCLILNRLKYETSWFSIILLGSFE